jgi:hypothetical protein
MQPEDAPCCGDRDPPNMVEKLKVCTINWLKRALVMFCVTLPVGPCGGYIRSSSLLSISNAFEDSLQRVYRHVAVTSESLLLMNPVTGFW